MNEPLVRGIIMFKNALVSVTDKTGLAEFLKPYVDQGLRVVSTGGTAQYLRDHGIPVVYVQDQTGFPEVMDGRVRTLHPSIHMPLLARTENPEDMSLLKEYKLEPFDLVIGNLYPFEKYSQSLSDLRELSEYIDIGGPALLRASAKNYHQITVVCDPADYSWISEKKSLDLEDRRKLAAKLFAHISNYDSLISKALGQGPVSAMKATFPYELVSELRYGENPQQKAYWLKESGLQGGLHESKILQGKALSYNNILDLDAAVDLVRLFDEPCCVGVKHNNPCGVAIANTIEEAVAKALAADPKSIFGGIVATNREISLECAKALSQIFLECIIAPKISKEAQSLFSEKKNLRIIEWENYKTSSGTQIKSISGGFLLQTKDEVSAWGQNWKFEGEKPSQEIQKDLSFSWRVCSALKSNAITIMSEGVTVGLGMGQVSRVDSVIHAIERMKAYHPNVTRPVLASDAFFPFEDSIEMIAKAGIRWVIQPGGSVRDEQVILTAKKLGVNLVLTGTRHFKH